MKPQKKSFFFNGSIIPKMLWRFFCHNSFLAIFTLKKNLKKNHFATAPKYHGPTKWILNRVRNKGKKTKKIEVMLPWNAALWFLVEPLLSPLLQLIHLQEYTCTAVNARWLAYLMAFMNPNEETNLQFLKNTKFMELISELKMFRSKASLWIFYMYKMYVQEVLSVWWKRKKLLQHLKNNFKPKKWI